MKYFGSGSSSDYEIEDTPQQKRAYIITGLVILFIFIGLIVLCAHCG